MALPENYRIAENPKKMCVNCFFISGRNFKPYCVKWKDYVVNDYTCNAWKSQLRVRRKKIA